jgi:hypothetical protein
MTKENKEKMHQVLVTMRNEQIGQIEDERKKDSNFNFSKFVRFQWDDYMSFRNKSGDIVGSEI